FGARVLLVMAAETAAKVRVSEMIGIRSPTDLHLGKNIVLINAEQGPRAAHHLVMPVSVNLRIALAVVILEGRGNPAGGIIAARVRHLEDLEALLLGKGQSRGNVTERHRAVHGALGQLERVRRTIVTIDALHGVHFVRIRFAGSGGGVYG